MHSRKIISTSFAHEHLVEKLPHVVCHNAWGEASYFYNPGHALKRGTYFATIKEKNGENDRASDLDRPGVWRLNIGIRKETFLTIFNAIPKRAPKGGVIEGPWDFTATDIITPHPIYGWMCWIAVLSPSEDAWAPCISLITDAHLKASITFEKRRLSKAGGVTVRPIPSAV